MALFLSATETSHNASLRSEASNLLRLTSRRIEAGVSDYVFFLGIASTIAYVFMWGLLGSQSAVAAFGRTMEKHRTAGHQDGSELTQG